VHGADGAARPVWLHEPAVGCYSVRKLVGFAVFMWLVDHSGYHPMKDVRFGGGAHPWDVLSSFDGGWHQEVAEFGCNPQLMPATGFPLVHIPGELGRVLASLPRPDTPGLRVHPARRP
jgi:hypothetical protein